MNPFNAKFDIDKKSFNASFKNVHTTAEKYTGVTVVTPTEETQILETRGKVIDSDICINPIPNNYGRIEWNGSIMRII